MALGPRGVGAGAALEHDCVSGGGTRRELLGTVDLTAARYLTASLTKIPYLATRIKGFCEELEVGEQELEQNFGGSSSATVVYANAKSPLGDVTRKKDVNSFAVFGNAFEKKVKTKFVMRGGKVVEEEETDSDGDDGAGGADGAAFASGSRRSSVSLVASANSLVRSGLPPCRHASAAARPFFARSPAPGPAGRVGVSRYM